MRKVIGSSIFALLDEAFANYSFDRDAVQDEDRWQSPLFDFTRRVKAISQLRDLAASDALRVIKWWMAHSSMKWEEFDGVDGEEDGCADFVHSWMRGKFAYGEDPLDAAFKDQQELESHLDPSAYPWSDTYRKFLEVCFCLNRVNGGAKIAIPIQRFGKLLGVSARTIGTYRQVAIEEGLLLPHRTYSREARRASEFLFKPEALEWAPDISAGMNTEPF